MHMKIFLKYILDGFFRMRSLIQSLNGKMLNIAPATKGHSYTFNGNYSYSKMNIYIYKDFSNVKIIRKTFYISLKKKFENCYIFDRILVSSERPHSRSQ